MRTYDIDCVVCETSFTSTQSKAKYCSQKCRNKTYNNSTRNCAGCGKILYRHNKNSYCQTCRFKKEADEYIALWLAGEVPGGSVRKLSEYVRNYMLDEAGMKCSQCGFDTLHPVDGSCVLEVDHIDGNGENHAYENLRVLCPNCHALTPTYRGRNAGSGRKVFYTRTVRSS